MSPTPPRLPEASQTKIVATVGPACDREDQLFALLQAGVDVFRLNMAHAGPADQQSRLTAIRSASNRAARPVAVLVDLAGPKMRLGEIPGAQLQLHANQLVRFVRALPSAAVPGQPPGHAADASAPDAIAELTCTYEPLVDELAVGNRIMLADGTVALVVEQLGPGNALCRVIEPGLVRSRQGLNLPGAKLTVAALSPTDRENAVWAAQNDIDFVGLSFVRAAAEVRQLKALLQTHNPQTQVIAKIEKPEALDHLDEILEAADGIMVARGDLGVEIDIAQVAVVQKQIVAKCNCRRKPVIIATQMLDSMQHNPLPTRAEVTDVANAILDGADACMLSGETAIGEYPRQSVEMMHRIALSTEPLCRQRTPSPCPEPTTATIDPITHAAAYYAGRLAEQLDARLIAVATASGATALALAKNHTTVPIVGVSSSAPTLRRMCLYWGVIPLAGAPTDDPRAMLNFVILWGRSTGQLAPRDRVVLIAGTGLAVTHHNMIVVHQLDD